MHFGYHHQLISYQVIVIAKLSSFITKPVSTSPFWKHKTISVPDIVRNNIIHWWIQAFIYVVCFCNDIWKLVFILIVDIIELSNILWKVICYYYLNSSSNKIEIIFFELSVTKNKNMTQCTLTHGPWITSSLPF